MTQKKFTNRFGEFTIYDYSEKCIALVGDTKDAKNVLKELGGRYCHNLKNIEDGMKGWVFSKNKHASNLRKFMTEYPGTKVEEPKVTANDLFEQAI